ncbi:MAG: hypothetical protein FWF02_05040 [Micrococcales bacterium]|nr:hypothetical protein [Micrococcales bacterium]MCL2667059.1 hypothetical protein [Micrococcales bacterium]
MAAGSRRPPGAVTKPAPTEEIPTAEVIGLATMKLRGRIRLLEPITEPGDDGFDPDEPDTVEVRLDVGSLGPQVDWDLPGGRLEPTSQAPSPCGWGWKDVIGLPRMHGGTCVEVRALVMTDGTGGAAGDVVEVAPALMSTLDVGGLFPVTGPPVASGCPTVLELLDLPVTLVDIDILGAHVDYVDALDPLDPLDLDLAQVYPLDLGDVPRPVRQPAPHEPWLDTLLDDDCLDLGGSGDE